MSNSTHHEEAKDQKKSVISFRSSFWFVIILVFLFIAALNFVTSFSKGEGEGEEKGKEGTEKVESVKEHGADMETKAVAPPTDMHKDTMPAAAH